MADEAERRGAVRLGELLTAAWRSFSRQGQAQFAEAGLSAARVRLLDELATSPGTRMGDLAARLGVSARAITPTVDRLEAEGLVVRKVDPSDRRAYLLELTPAGAAQVARIRELQKQVSARIFSVLTPEQRDTLEELLATFVAASGDACAEPQPEPEETS